MASFKGGNFDERLSNAANAKKALLEKAKAKLQANDPAAAERQAARVAAQLARDQRAAERKVAQAAATAAAKEQAAREAAEKLSQEQAARERAAREKAEKATRAAELEAQQKAARDARYAARKARK